MFEQDDEVPEQSAAKIVEKLPLISQLCDTQMTISSETLRISGLLSSIRGLMCGR